MGNEYSIRLWLLRCVTPGLLSEQVCRLDSLLFVEVHRRWEANH